MGQTTANCEKVPGIDNALTIMKRIVLMVLLPGGLSAAEVLSQEPADLLEEHYSAAAQEKMSAVETIVTSGKNIYSMAGFETTFTSYQARPNRIRVEADFQGSNVIQTYNGEKGWIYAPVMGIPEPAELRGYELKTLLAQSGFENPLWNYRSGANTLEVVEGESEESEYHLKLTSREGEVRHFYLDRKTMLIHSVGSTRVMGGTESRVELVLDRYRTIRGIPVAHRVITRLNGQTVTTIEIEKVEFNRKLDPALFEKPEAE